MTQGKVLDPFFPLECLVPMIVGTSCVCCTLWRLDVQCYGNCRLFEMFTGRLMNYVSNGVGVVGLE